MRVGLRGWVLVRMLVLAVAAFGLLQAARASADRKYFLESYTSYLAPAGQVEVENWLTAKAGKQDSTQHTAWEPRVEFEYSVTDRFTAAGYLNFSQGPGEALRFETPSIELIYRFADPGRIVGDPAVYLETSENGEELELEPKLLLAHRSHRWVGALNFVGEFEFRHNEEELLPGGEILDKEFKGEISAGLAYEVVPAVSLALESRYRAEYPNFGSRADAVFSLGPSLNVQSGRVQLAIGYLPQFSGSPKTSGNRNLVDFEKTQVRAVLGVDL